MRRRRLGILGRVRQGGFKPCLGWSEGLQIRNFQTDAADPPAELPQGLLKLPVQRRGAISPGPNAADKVRDGPLGLFLEGLQVRLPAAILQAQLLEA